MAKATTMIVAPTRLSDAAPSNERMDPSPVEPFVPLYTRMLVEGVDVLEWCAEDFVFGDLVFEALTAGMVVDNVEEEVGIVTAVPGSEAGIVVDVLEGSCGVRLLLEGVSTGGSALLAAAGGIVVGDTAGDEDGTSDA